METPGAASAKLPSQTTDGSPAILFFDGVCGLCNRSVDFLLRRDRRGRLRFAPLQGETARAKLGERAEAMASLIVLDGGQLFERSEAILQAGIVLGGMWRLLATIARLVPRFIRDRLYDLIAQRRYRWFGRRETCRQPNAQERPRFLP